MLKFVKICVCAHLKTVFFFFAAYLGNWSSTSQTVTGDLAEASAFSGCAHQDVSCSFSFLHQIPPGNEIYKKKKERKRRTATADEILDS